jgi:hypothetical protein
MSTLVAEAFLWLFRKRINLPQSPADLSHLSQIGVRTGRLGCLHRILATAGSKLKARGRGSCQSLLASHSPIQNPPSAPPWRCVYLPGV